MERRDRLVVGGCLADPAAQLTVGATACTLLSKESRNGIDLLLGALLEPALTALPSSNKGGRNAGVALLFGALTGAPLL